MDAYQVGQALGIITLGVLATLIFKALTKRAKYKKQMFVKSAMEK